MVDVNQQLFASGRQPGALGSMGAGEVDAKRSAIPLLAVVLGFKDSAGYLKVFESPGFVSGGVNGIGGAFTPKSGDKVIQAFQNTGEGDTRFQNMVASGPRNSGERGV
jgi:hypothetical protein